MTSRGLRAGALVVSCLLVGSCGDAGAAVTAPAASPMLTAAGAATVLSAYEFANNEANTSGDVPALSRIETPPLRLASEAKLRVEKTLDRPIPLITTTDPHFLIPSGGEDRQWFVSSGTRLRGEVVATGQTYLVFTRPDPGSGWRAEYCLTLPDRTPAPAVAVNKASSAAAVTDFRDLVLQPDALAQAIFAHYTRNLAGQDAFGHSVALDEQLGRGFEVASQVLLDRGTRLNRTPLLDPPQVLALRTSDGGALVFSTSTLVDDLTPVKSGGTVSLTAGGNEAALYGSVSGATAARFSVVRQQTFLTYLPRKASGDQAIVLAYTDVPIRIS